MPLEARSPTECVLVIAVPLDAHEFRDAWDRGSDFLSVYSTYAIGWRAYESTARLACRLAEECEALGAAVVRRTRLHDLTDAMERYRAVTLIAHMAFPAVTDSDVLDRAALHRLVEESQDPEWNLVRAEMTPRTASGDLIRAINGALERSEHDLSSPSTVNVSDGIRFARQRTNSGLLRLDRVRLEELCGPSVLRPARGIELAVLHTAAEFTAAIPPDYRGFLDLRLCNSVSIGAAIRRRRPHLGLAVGKRPAHVDAQLVLYKTALVYMQNRAIADRPISYEEAMMSITEAGR